MTKNEVEIQIDSIFLKGNLAVPERPKGIVLFAHGSGSSRLSPRNSYVAEILEGAGFATLLFDLLTEEEDRAYENRFDIDLLTDRLIAATKWVNAQSHLKNLPIGYFGASTGSAGAINAAAHLKGEIKAVVSRGGRPDLSRKSALASASSPILLIVGGKDNEVLQLHRQILPHIHAENKLEIIPDATHLFEEPGALEKVAQLATDWFLKYLKRNY
jgi:putative phosphoribosyl transferase